MSLEFTTVLKGESIPLVAKRLAPADSTTAQRAAFSSLLAARNGYAGVGGLIYPGQVLLYLTEDVPKSPPPPPVVNVTPATRLFSASSPFNTPIPAGTQWYDHQCLHWMNNDPATNTPVEFYLGFDALGIYYAQPTDPLWTFNMPAYVAPTWNRNRPASSFAFRAPANIALTADTDKILVVIDSTTGDYVEVWNTVIDSAARTVTCGADAPGWARGNVLTGPGAGTLGGNNDGVRAANFSWAAGAITGRDIAAGRFDHALAVALPWSMLKGGGGQPVNFRAPATAPDAGGWGGPILMGSRIGIPASTPKPAGLLPLQAAMFDCLQTYGMFVGDFCGGPWPVLYGDRFTTTSDTTVELQNWSNGHIWNVLSPLLRVADYQP